MTGCKPPSAQALLLSGLAPLPHLDPAGASTLGDTQEGSVITRSSLSSTSSWEAIKMMELGVEVLEKLSRKRGTKAEHGVWRVLMWEDQRFLSEDNRGG